MPPEPIGAPLGENVRRLKPVASLGNNQVVAWLRWLGHLATSRDLSPDAPTHPKGSLRMLLTKKAHGVLHYHHTMTICIDTQSGSNIFSVELERSAGFQRDLYRSNRETHISTRLSANFFRQLWRKANQANVSQCTTTLLKPWVAGRKSQSCASDNIIVGHGKWWTNSQQLHCWFLSNMMSTSTSLPSSARSRIAKRKLPKQTLTQHVWQYRCVFGNARVLSIDVSSTAPSCHHCRN